MISPEGFARGFHQCASIDFIVRETNDFIFLRINQNPILAENYYGRKHKLAELSTDFAVSILKLTDGIKGHYSLCNQLERSGTSIGANIREAKYAHSKPDFVSKLQISLKECYETEYWLEIAVKAGIIPEDSVKSLIHDCGTIRRMLISPINTAKENQ